MIRELAKRGTVRRLSTRIPILSLITFGEIALLARRHLKKLTPAEKQRLKSLIRKGKLSQSDVSELRSLILKIEPLKFALRAADKASPIPLPTRLKPRKTSRRR